MNEELVLIHHGVKGMKWGVRRYQNPDGSLTAEGKQHYGTTHPMTRRQAKKAIRRSKFWGRKEVAKVDEAFRKEQESDKQLQEAGKRKRLTELERKLAYNDAVEKEQEYQDIKDGGETKFWTAVKRGAADALWDEYDEADSAYREAKREYAQRKVEIGKKYYEAYKRAAVKDMGLEDIDAGVKMLEEYGLESMAVGWLRSDYRPK